jgi:hypothetical protein
MEGEAKLEFTITVNWRREDGSIATTQLATLARDACRSAEDAWVCNSRTRSQFSGGCKRLWPAKQLQRYCEAVRPCPRCHHRRRLKECTVNQLNQLINWRMYKKQQMGWSRAGAQDLLHVKTAISTGDWTVLGINESLSLSSQSSQGKQKKRRARSAGTRFVGTAAIFYSPDWPQMNVLVTNCVKS